MNKETIILFDLDGTLIDSTDAILASFNNSFKELKFDFKGTNEDIKALIGHPLDVMYVSLGVEDERKWEFVDTYKQFYKKISVEQTYLLDNATEAVELASSIARVSVVTTKTRMYTMPLLENLNLASHFEIVTGRENVENPKPHPEPINITLEQMNYDENRHDVWMIGDTKLDLIAARDANVNSVGVLCGYGTHEELSKYTQKIENDALEAVKLIQNLKK